MVRRRDERDKNRSRLALRPGCLWRFVDRGREARHRVRLKVGPDVLIRFEPGRAIPWRAWPGWDAIVVRLVVIKDSRG